MRKIQKASCPHCGAVLNATTQVQHKDQLEGLEPEAVPEAADVTFCSQCVTCLQFTEDGGLVFASPEVVADIPQDTLDRVEAARQFVNIITGAGK